MLQLKYYFKNVLKCISNKMYGILIKIKLHIIQILYNYTKKGNIIY